MNFFSKIFKRPSLKERVALLEKLVTELSRKTISKTTTEEDTLPTPKQILNEWFNGKEGDE